MPTVSSKPVFVNCFRLVCWYCANQCRVSHRDGYYRECGLRPKKDGTFEPLSLEQETCGCELFKTSGLPAHPLNYQVLVRRNPLAVAIPQDEEVIESRYFENEIGKYPHLERDIYHSISGELLGSEQ